MQKLSETYGKVLGNPAFTNIPPFNRKLNPMRTLRALRGAMQYHQLPKEINCKAVDDMLAGFVQAAHGVHLTSGDAIECAGEGNPCCTSDALYVAYARVKISSRSDHNQAAIQLHSPTRSASHLLLTTVIGVSGKHHVQWNLLRTFLKVFTGRIEQTPFNGGMQVPE